MACILLDVDGVLHVSGEPIPVQSTQFRLRRGYLSVRHEQLDRPRAKRRRASPCELDDDEPRRRPAPPRARGKRVFAS
jgi:hypothetical protein